jgi:hypothetical protein
MNELDVSIGEVVTDLTFTEPVGSLAPDEVKRLVMLVAEHLKRTQDLSVQRARDVTVTNSAYRGVQG